MSPATATPFPLSAPPDWRIFDRDMPTDDGGNCGQKSSTEKRKNGEHKTGNRDRGDLRCAGRRCRWRRNCLVGHSRRFSEDGSLTEEFFRPFEKAFSQWRILFPAQLAELLQFRALLGV